jgi:hypothetical protein
MHKKQICYRVFTVRSKTASMALSADDIYKAAQSNDQSDYFPLLAGQGVGLLKQKGQSASEMVEEIASEAKNILGHLNGIIE